MLTHKSLQGQIWPYSLSQNTLPISLRQAPSLTILNPSLKHIYFQKLLIKDCVFICAYVLLRYKVPY